MPIRTYKKKHLKKIKIKSSWSTYRGRYHFTGFLALLYLDDTGGEQKCRADAIPYVTPSSVSQKPLTTTQILFHQVPKDYLVPLFLLPTSCHHLKQLHLFKHLNSQFRALRVSAKSEGKRIKYKCNPRLIIIAIVSEVAAQMPETTDTNCSSSSSAHILWQLKR